MIRAVLLLLLACLLLPRPAAAHEIRPVFLDIRETGTGSYAVSWKRPALNGGVLAIHPVFPKGCEVLQDGLPQVTGAFAVERMALRCRDSLAGAAIGFSGLSSAMVDGLVRVQFASGQMATGRVLPSRPSFTVPASASGWQVLRTYVRLGVEHILLGYDHLVFVLALVLFVRRWRRLLTTATAFTLAHSITLSMAAMGAVHVPVAPVETMIAVSILLMALELLQVRNDPGRAAGLRPAGLAFGFGLLHGLGFASALAEIGLPQHEIPLALLSFNLGVELGQVAFIAALLGAGWLLRRLAPPWQARAYTAGVYAIGGLSAFWALQRLSTF